MGRPAHAFATHQGVDNVDRIWALTLPSERQEGRIYYPRQRMRLLVRADDEGLRLEQVVGAFAALSPNNTEKNTYLALDALLTWGRVWGWEHNREPKVSAYGLNRRKATYILQHGESDPVDTLRGTKVVSFYHNTLYPDSSKFVTVDGHMRNLYYNELAVLKARASNVSLTEYKTISAAINKVAEHYCVPTPAFQATLWVAWKRINNISHNPQGVFEF